MAKELPQGQSSHGSQHSYPQKEANATPAFSSKLSSENRGTHPPLSAKICSRIQSQGPIPFRDYMEMALYDPDSGYYATGIQRVGKEGDFITSVSIGRCFGLILSRRLAAFWEESGKPDTFHIIEPGAHDGALCADILGEALAYDPEFYQAIHYHLIETAPALIQAQQQRLKKAFAGKFTPHTSLKELRGIHGAILSNELMDAFPVDLVHFESGKWWQLLVGETDGALEFIPAECRNEELSNFCQALDEAGTNYAEGYTTEFNPSLSTFAREAGKALDSGLFISIDYGHHAEDYYHPDRSAGTLQTYHQHQKSDDPLAFPGEIDITSHVDFTHLTTAAESAGFGFTSLSTQASYLTNHARAWLMSLETSQSEETQSLLRQFQTLTHPAMLGTKFMVLEMKKT